MDNSIPGTVAEIGVDPARARVYAEGWQSWSPSIVTSWGQGSPRPADERLHDHFWRRGAPWNDPGMDAPGTVQSDGGLLAIDPGTGGDVMILSAPDPGHIPVIRAIPQDSRYIVTADGPCTQQRFPGPISAALAAWAGTWPESWDGQWKAGGSQWTATDDRRVEPFWCTWYACRRDISPGTVTAAADAIDRHGLPVTGILWDDGYFRTLGDWQSTVRPGLGSLQAMAGHVCDRGLAPGLWLCPTLAETGSEAVRSCPEAWVPGVDAPFGSRRRVRILDPTSPAGAAYLTELIRGIVAAGFGEFLKLDFLWTGALPGPRASGASPVEAYREGLRLIRRAAGPGTRLLACGAPTLASVHAGLTSLRVSPDTGPAWDPPGGDLSQPAGRSSVVTGQARAHLAALIRPDPDVLMAGPEVERREDLAAHVAALPANVRASGDRLDALDDWGIAATRQLLSREPAGLPSA